MNEATMILLAAIVTGVVLAGLGMFIVYARNMSRMAEAEHPTGFLDDDPGPVCGICFGELDGGSSKCTCGRVFHDTCAQPTGSCPYCGTGYGEFRPSDDERVRCPNCGRYVCGTECRCGALFPRNGVFICSCGAEMEDGKPCISCGKEYITGGKK